MKSLEVFMKLFGIKKCYFNQGYGVLIPSHHSWPRFQSINGLNYGWQEDWIWWYSGGLTSTADDTAVPTSLSSSDLLKGKSWRRSVDMPHPNGVSYHCKVQINHCETAVISGYTQYQSKITTIYNAVSSSNNIFNFKM